MSRSFYLTLRLLPGEVRESVSLAYLLARLTDTEADGAVTTAERELVARRGELEKLLSLSPDREVIGRVWRTIQEGQAFDGRRFPPGAPPLDPEELDRYTYLVAGSVGEFWTDICAAHLPGFAQRAVPEMRALGVRFGKGLQLVNILRDRAADGGIGRRYVAPGRLAAVLLSAREQIVDAGRYVRALRPRRLRAATALPWLLAEATLDLIELQPDAARVKVPRWRVWFFVLKSFLV